jgi:hypothetical protein
LDNSNDSFIPQPGKTEAGAFQSSLTVEYLDIQAHLGG